MVAPGESEPTRPAIGMFSGVGNSITDADDAFLRIVGYTRAEFEAAVAERRMFSPIEWQEADLEVVRRGEREGGIPIVYRKELLRRDDSRVPVLAVVGAEAGSAPTADGRRWTAYAIDLTAPRGCWPTLDRVRAGVAATGALGPLTDQLVRERGLWVEMLNSTSVQIWAVGPDLQLLDRNDAYRRLRAQLTDRVPGIGDPLEQTMINPAAWELWSGWYRRALAGESFSVRRAPGDLGRTYEFTFSPITDPLGEPMGVVAVGVDVTEEVAAVAALTENEARLRSVFRHLPDLAYIANERWEITYISEAVTDLLGRDVDSLLGTSVWDIVQADVVEPNPREIKATLATPGSRATLRLRVPGAAGQVQWFEVDMVNLLHDPAVCGYAATARDVTDEHVRAERLATSESLLRIASRLGQVAGWVVDLPSQQVQLSREVVDLFEAEPERAVLADDRPTVDQTLEYFPEATRHALRAALAGAIEQGTPFDLEVAAPTATGRQRWLRMMCEPQRDQSGAVVRLDGAVADVTEARVREERLRDKAELLDTATEGIISCRWDGIVTYWNRAAEHLYGWPAAAAIGRHVADLIDGGQMSRYEAIREHLLREGVFSGRIDSIDPEGSRVVVELRSKLLRDDAGRPTTILSIVSDLSARVELEERLAMARKLESVGQLTGGLAHDFNNLLTVVIGGAELLADELAGDARLTELVTTVLDAAQIGSELTARLLAFARQQQLRPTVVNTRDVVLGIEQLLRRSLNDRVELRIECDDDLWNVRVDPGQLEAALVNVAVNARDAMPDGGELRIVADNVVVDDAQATTWGDLAPGGYVRLAVTDTGTGIAPELRTHVFDPFFTTKDTGRGSGLGLSMVYGFVRQSGGHVELASQVGLGTTITMYLPSTSAELTSAPVEALPTELVGGSERVLVVEDDQRVRDHAVRLLEGLGYSVIRASTGAEALAIAERGEPFDLLFTDIVMPGGINGVELARRMAAIRPAARVLFTSGYHEIDAAQFDPSVHLVVKPYRRATLAAALRRAIDRPDPTG